MGFLLSPENDLENGLSHGIVQQTTAVAEVVFVTKAVVPESDPAPPSSGNQLLLSKFPEEAAKRKTRTGQNQLATRWQKVLTSSRP